MQSNAIIIRPSSDGTYYGMVMSVHPSVRPSRSPSVRLSVHPGLRPPVFLTFLQHALTNWAEILHMTLFYCTTDQVRVLSICVKFCWSYAPFGTYNTGNTQFSALFSYMLWHICVNFCGSYAPFGTQNTEITHFPHFSLTCFDILSWNFAHDFVLLKYRSSSSLVNLRQFLWEFFPFWNLE